MPRTKKIGSAGRFGSRYGRTIRQKVANIEKKQKAPKKCPYCNAKKVKRLSFGIWQCKKCKNKFTGKAYSID